jgi:hypothetical protein
MQYTAGPMLMCPALSDRQQGLLSLSAQITVVCFAWHTPTPLSCLQKATGFVPADVLMAVVLCADTCIVC